MPTDLHWTHIALRLMLTVIAGTVLGVERSKSGHPAGLRTTLLVTMAASVSMIQMNLLIQTNGKPHDSYIVMDLMRLPLGILTGVGFIGAGAIVRKGDIVLGITTAATMWFATVVGLCLGGGQLTLGLIATAIGFLILWALRFVESHLETYQRGVITVSSNDTDVSIQSLSDHLRSGNVHIHSTSVLYEGTSHSKFRFEVKWHRSSPNDVPKTIEYLRRLQGVTACEWDTTGHAASW